MIKITANHIMTIVMIININILILCHLIVLSTGKGLHGFILLIVALIHQVVHREDSHLGVVMMIMMIMMMEMMAIMMMMMMIMMMMTMMIRYPTSPLPLSTIVTTPAILAGCLRTPLEEDIKINV